MSLRLWGKRHNTMTLRLTHDGLKKRKPAWSTEQQLVIQNAMKKKIVSEDEENYIIVKKWNSHFLINMKQSLLFKFT